MKPGKQLALGIRHGIMPREFGVHVVRWEHGDTPSGQYGRDCKETLLYA
jgi:hypothetical protein